jgi:hypothetical protein
MSDALRRTSSTAKPVAHALAFRWGELLEAPPAFIDDLMVDLTEALAEAEADGDEIRTECLDEVLDALAQGIVKYHRHSAGHFDEKTLDRAIGEIRSYYYRESDLPSEK